jgi:5-methyltetrahydrofolate--homocysteine methyltransferase
MFVIGERINGMFTAIGDAILAKDPLPVRAMAEQQIACGANALDVNVGTRVPKAERPAVMKWLVETTREVTDMCLAIDTPSLEIMRVGLDAACRKGTGMINSTTGHAEKLAAFMNLAKEFNASIIGLAIDENGVASTADAKVEIGMRVLAAAMEVGIATDSVYLDPITLPLNCA